MGIQLLDKNHIRYTSIDITNNREAQEYMLKHFNTTAIPAT